MIRKAPAGKRLPATAVTLLVAVLLTIGCQGGDAPPVSATGAVSERKTGATPDTAAVAPPGFALQDFPGPPDGAPPAQQREFKRRLAAYVEARDLLPADNEDFAQGTSVEFLCRPLCGELTRVRFLILPEKNMRRLNWAEELQTETDPEARIVGVYINQDDVPVPELGLNPGDRMHVWVGRITTSGSRGIGLFRYNPADTTVTYLFGTREFKVCTDPVTGRNKASIKIGDQPGHVCSSTVLRGTGPNLPPRGGRRGPPDNVWVACDGGCCQADM